MKLEIRSFSGIDRADIELAHGVTMLVGKNGVGKTSVIEALQTVLSADVNLFVGSKKESEVLVHRGAKESSILFSSRSGTRKVEFPDCKVSTLDGSLPKVTDLALGLKPITTLSREERSKLLSDYLHAEVSEQRLIAELKELGCPSDLAASLPRTIFGDSKVPGRGWDAGQKEAETLATQTKGEFKRTTNFVWGKNQGLTFTPAGWEPDLANATAESLNAEIVAANEKVEALIRSNAISEQEYVNLQELVRTGALATDDVKKWAETLASIEAEGKDASEAVLHGNAKRYDCPCGQTAFLVDTATGWRSFDTPPDENAAELAAAAKRAATERYKNARLALEIAQGKVAAGEAAAEKLQGLEKPTEAGAQVDEAKKEVERARVRQRAWDIKQQGLHLHERIIKAEKVAELLSPEGLRRRILAAQLVPFNKELAQLCDLAGYENVSVDEKMSIKYGASVRPSESELYRCEAVLRLALAKQKKEPIVIFDRADVLADREGRNGLIRLIAALELNVVIGMALTANKKGEFDVPDLRAAGIGITYWVEGGTVKEFVNAQPASV